MSLCRTCSRPVVFAMDEAGKWQVLDPIAPVFKLINNQRGKATCGRDTKAMVSHWVTCSGREQMKALIAQSPPKDFNEPQEAE